MTDPSAPLPGRDTAWSAVSGLVHDEDGGALLVVGGPGLGKTELLDRAQQVAGLAGHRTLRIGVGQFHPVGTLEGLSPLLRPVLAHLTDIRPGERAAIEFVMGADAVPPPSRLMTRTAVLSLLRSAATHAPVLVLVDDSQWLDHPSSELLSFVARRLARTRVRMIVAARPGHSTPLERAGLPRVGLEPIDDTAARALLRGRRPDLPEQDHQRVLAIAAGNPLVLLELADTHRPAGAAGSGGDARSRLPDNVAAVFGPRIASLPPTTRDALLVAALEETGDLGMVTLAAGEAALDHLSIAEQAGLLAVDETTGMLHFRHPLVPHTVVTLADPTHRRTAHARLATALGITPLRRMWHLAEAADGPDEPTAALVEEQAHLALRRGDATRAGALLQRSAELSPQPSERVRRQVGAALIDADVTGDLSGAQELLADARRRYPDESGSLATALVGAFVLLNAECEVDTAHRILVEAIRCHPGRDDPEDPVLVQALHSLLMMCWFGGRPALWQDFRGASARLGTRAPTLLEVCHRTFGDAGHQDAGAITQLDDLLRGLPREHDPVAVTQLALACVYTDRLHRCRQSLQRVIEDAREGGAVALGIHALVSRSVDAWLTGQWDEALAMVAEGMSLAHRHGYRRYSVILGGYIDQLVRIARGDLHDGREADEMMRWATERGAGMCVLFADHVLALRASCLGDFESAYRHVTAIATPGHLPAYTPHALWVLFDLVEAATVTGRLGEARAHVAEMERRRIADLSPRLRMVVAGCRGLTASSDGAVGAFEEALGVREGPQWPLDRARIQLAYGEHLHRARDLDAAQRHLAEASACFHRLGARPWQARADASLRAAGVVVDRLAARAATDRALTPRERQIAELAARGLTNRQIGDLLHLSPRSVGAVLYRCFPKLGVTSRAALAAALERTRADAEEPLD